MPEPPLQTESLCPHCFRRIPALRISENNAVYLEKKCPECGDLGRTLIWKDDPRNYQEWSRNAQPSEISAHCPFECGICPNHKQETCSAIIEVTNRCNLHCPVCFAASGDISAADPDLDHIARDMRSVLEHRGAHPIQLSGGEPTLRDDLPQIVAMARKMGFDHIQINTNGVRLAQESDYGLALKESGATLIFLQFDGVSDDVYRYIRGADLFSLKLKAIERCAELRFGVILVPTIVKGVNDSQLGAIIQLAKKWIPSIKGVHFQPATYMGRFPEGPRNAERILIPDILSFIEQQTTEFKADDFIAPG
jgi:7,8-dihydro-6-hydroxymethylpterin dimethyltransferase